MHNRYTKILMLSIASWLGLFHLSASPASALKADMNVFKTPVHGFSGWWEVVRHEAASGHALPQDWPDSVRDNTNYLPVGKIIHIQPIGDVMMKWGTNKNGDFKGITGDGFKYTVFPPFGEDYCPINSKNENWKFSCDIYRKENKPFSQILVITKINHRKDFSKIWPKVEPYWVEVGPQEVASPAIDGMAISRDKKELYLLLLEPIRTADDDRKIYPGFLYSTVLKRIASPKELEHGNQPHN
jgi:hypothetical protein